MMADVMSEEYAAVLDEIAATALQTAGIEKPPIDALRLAQGLGLIVAIDKAQTGRARRVRLLGQSSPQSLILVREEPRQERQQWSVAHEIGEHLAEHVFARLAISACMAPDGAREQVANHLASRLLLPEAWFEAATRDDDFDLFALKRRFTTASNELIARRLLDFPPPTIITIFDHARLTFRRGSGPHPVPPPSTDEMACWRETHEHNRPESFPAYLPYVFGWPIHEPNWKREILRTVLDG